MVMVINDVVFRGTLVGAKVFVTVGALLTVRVAEAVKPVPPFVELTVPVVFTAAPAVESVTATEMAQLVPAVAMDPPVSESERSPGFGEKVPPQVSVAAGVAATLIPEGSESVTATPDSAPPLPAGSVIVMVKVEVAPPAMLVGLKVLVMVGGAMTFRTALAVVPVPSFVELTAPVVLLLLPPVVLVTFTEMAHVEPGVAIEPPESPTLLFPDAPPLVVPPQLFVRAGVEATVIPGRERIRDGYAGHRPAIAGRISDGQG